MREPVYFQAGEVFALIHRFVPRPGCGTAHNSRLAVVHPVNIGQNGAMVSRQEPADADQDRSPGVRKRPMCSPCILLAGGRLLVLDKFRLVPYFIIPSNQPFAKIP